MGEGITAKTTLDTFKRIPGYEITPVESADWVVVSPGMPPEKWPKVNGELISEIECAYRLFHRPDSTYTPELIGIAGTNGKTTVTSLIGHLLDIPVAGNIGIPLIEFVDRPGPNYLAVELSSFQLYGVRDFRPYVGILLNITPDHLIWHGTFENYRDAKAKLFQAQTAHDWIVFNEEDPPTVHCVQGANAQKKPFSKKSPDWTQWTSPYLKGAHNQLNILAAAAAAQLCGMGDAAIQTRLNTFKGVPHRIEHVGCIEGREVYNDSKATNPDSTWVAVEAFPNNRIHLILCGEDKKIDMREFIANLNGKITSAIIWGPLADVIEKCVAERPVRYPVHRTVSLENTIEKAFEVSAPGDVILFSPASSSFDAFKNFEHRGDMFRQKMKERSA